MPERPRDEIDAFLNVPRIGKLATLRADGAPTIVPIWFEWDGSCARVFTSRRSAKVARIAADPRVALSVETGVGEDEMWVTVEGLATVEDGGWELAQRLAPRYYAPEKARAALADWEKSAADWVVIRITPGRVVAMP